MGSSLLPHGETLRRAVRWISDHRTEREDVKLAELIDEAARRYDLSPAETEFLLRELMTSAEGGGPSGRSEP